MSFVGPPDVTWQDRLRADGGGLSDDQRTVLGACGAACTRGTGSTRVSPRDGTGEVVTRLRDMLLNTVTRVGGMLAACGDMS